ncbi:translin-associated factor X-interacting protein 1 isoform X3 [Ascaphus truei]|uniref:translin-associated factor X-interacting protein 1 isoform X3 n=1 Tax=Ascaphus truei TaxID=8439 RepID=UPI003F59E10C
MKRSSLHLSVPIIDQSTNANMRAVFHHKGNPPLGESWPGHVSTWPAYGAGQTILQKRKPCTAPVLKYYRTADYNANVVSKPRYLEQLESYLRKELQSLELTKVNAQELKLQPYREVFDYFIEDFKTYKPLLCAIKKEYEVTLAHQREQIRALEPLKAMLVSVSERCDQKIQAMRDVELLEIKTLKMEKLNLVKVIYQMKEEESSLQAQVSKLQKELAHEYLLYRNECDARKLLIADINELKYQQEDITLSKVHDEHGEDPVTLALALKMARTDLMQTQIELSTMKADYGDVVPRRDFDNQQKKLDELLQKIDLMQKDFCQLQKEHNSLLEVNNQVLLQRDALYAEVDQLQRSRTPRPMWDKCADVLPGGFERWSSLSEGRTSDQMVDVLLTELGTRELQEKEFFNGAGREDNVPVHLRHEGPIKNLKLSTKDVYGVLREVWKEKTTSDQQKAKPSLLSEFFLTYLQKRFGDSAIEWSYGVHETCKVHITNDRMYLFYNILMGQVDEEVYHALIHAYSHLLSELVNADGANSGLLSREQFSLQLRNAFPLKSADEFRELLGIAESQIKTDDDSIPYKSLFTEDEEGTPSSFLAALTNQFAEEKREYLKELGNKLGNKEVRPEDLKMALLAVDPAIDAQTLESYISQAFQVPNGQLEQAEPIAPKMALQRLYARNVRKTGAAAIA